MINLFIGTFIAFMLSWALVVAVALCLYQLDERGVKVKNTRKELAIGIVGVVLVVLACLITLAFFVEFISLMIMMIAQGI